jgi:hypothetical protein
MATEIKVARLGVACAGEKPGRQSSVPFVAL